jgi:hypothetical protein
MGPVDGPAFFRADAAMIHRVLATPAEFRYKRSHETAGHDPRDARAQTPPQGDRNPKNEETHACAQ